MNRKRKHFIHVSAVLCCILLPSLVIPRVIQAQTLAGESLTGEWEFISVELGIPTAVRVQLTATGTTIAGKLYADGEYLDVKGSLHGSEIRLESKFGDELNVYVGTLEKNVMTGTFTVTAKEGTRTGTWSAKRAAAKPASPRTLDFIPTEFHRTLSVDTPPALRIWPDDTVRTKSVDAGGQDEKSAKRVWGGNPLTGPFYVEGAMPGDVLAITIKRLRVNRDWAMSDSGLVGRAMTTNYAANSKQDWSNTRWHLDAEKQIATLEKPPEHLKSFSVALHPMLGCVGVAPGPGDAPVSTQDSGDLGGNMDFNRISEGTTLYLQVNQPGALLYVGDAHALQGDGELNGNALETSMDIEFSVEVQREKSIGAPRAEDKDYLMAIGFAGSLDEAFRGATSEMANWLQKDYKLTSAEAAIVLGTSIKYQIAEVADRNVGVVAKIRKSSLALLAH